jgi:ribose 5-phosphate isomerase A
LNMV